MCLPRLQEHSNFVNAVRFSPDGNFFVTGGSDGKVRNVK